MNSIGDDMKAFGKLMRIITGAGRGEFREIRCTGEPGGAQVRTFTEDFELTTYSIEFDRGVATAIITPTGDRYTPDD